MTLCNYSSPGSCQVMLIIAFTKLNLVIAVHIIITLVEQCAMLYARVELSDLQKDYTMIGQHGNEKLLCIQKCAETEQLGRNLILVKQIFIVGEMALIRQIYSLAELCSLRLKKGLDNIVLYFVTEMQAKELPITLRNFLKLVSVT